MKPTIHKATEEDREKVKDWGIWEKEESEFPWEYSQEEHCLLLEGDVDVTNEEGEVSHFEKGDYVVFPKGMKCTWKINKKVRKHYLFK
ncbi:cupin domain-containing protein [Candidatus Woesearchaeota archaeon]|nr:cupin domain-containing protein [Candidatus Woesearchaeota archaeon]